MSYLTTSQPYGTPTWVDLGIPDLERAMEFYGAVFGWEYEVGPPETGRYTICTLAGRPAAGLAQTDSAPAYWWTVYFATDDCDGTAKRITDAGGALVQDPMDIPERGRMALATDPTGAQFGLWQAYGFIGAQVVNEPGALLRNDLGTPTPEPARAFYPAVFDFTLDTDPVLNSEFTFLRRPDGHEIGGIMGDPTATASAWTTLFEVADTDATLARAVAAGATAEPAFDMPYGRLAELTDPFGTPFTIGARV
jgi:uncharacterized protein